MYMEQAIMCHTMHGITLGSRQDEAKIVVIYGRMGGPFHVL